MKGNKLDKPDNTRGNAGVLLSVSPGICGFNCSISTIKAERRSVKVEILSDCEKIRKLADEVKLVGLRDALAPFSKNPVYMAAEKSGCHVSCPVPSAILKACEVALDIALPKEVKFIFGK